MCFTDASSCEAYLMTLPQGAATVQRAKALARAMLECQPTDQVCRHIGYISPYLACPYQWQSRYRPLGRLSSDASTGLP